MNVQYVPGVTTKNPDRHNASDALSGRWLLLARVVWIAIFVLTLVVFCANLIVGNYGLVSTILLVTVTSVWFAVSLVLFWRKSTDWNILLISLGLVLLGGVLVPPFPFALIHRNYWVLVFPIDFLNSLGQIALIIAYIFPDGRFVPSFTRWLALGWTAISFLFRLPAIIPGIFYPWNWWFPTFLTLVDIAYACSFVLALVYRYRRVSTPVQRQQIKWVVFATAIVFLWNSFVIGGTSVAELVLGVPLGLPINAIDLALANQRLQLLAEVSTALPVLFPLCIGISLLRYRLWDIDRVINRTLVYGILTTTLVLVYAGLVLALQALLHNIIHQTSDVAIVVSTLAIAALFQPLRQRLQHLIDRRFYRSKYDAAKTLAAFSATLHNEVDLDQLREQLVAVVQETMQPTHVSLWLRKPEQDGKRSTANKYQPYIHRSNPIR